MIKINMIYDNLQKMYDFYTGETKIKPVTRKVKRKS